MILIKSHGWSKPLVAPRGEEKLLIYKHRLAESRSVETKNRGKVREIRDPVSLLFVCGLNQLAWIGLLCSASYRISQRFWGTILLEVVSFWRGTWFRSRRHYLINTTVIIMRAWFIANNLVTRKRGGDFFLNHCNLIRRLLQSYLPIYFDLISQQNGRIYQKTPLVQGASCAIRSSLRVPRSELWIFYRFSSRYSTFVSAVRYMERWNHWSKTTLKLITSVQIHSNGSATTLSRDFMFVSCAISKQLFKHPQTPTQRTLPSLDPYRHYISKFRGCEWGLCPHHALSSNVRGG